MVGHCIVHYLVIVSNGRWYKYKINLVVYLVFVLLFILYLYPMKWLGVQLSAKCSSQSVKWAAPSTWSNPHSSQPLCVLHIIISLCCALLLIALDNTPTTWSNPHSTQPHTPHTTHHTHSTQPQCGDHTDPTHTLFNRNPTHIHSARPDRNYRCHSTHCRFASQATTKMCCVLLLEEQAVCGIPWL